MVKYFSACPLRRQAQSAIPPSTLNGGITPNPKSVHMESVQKKNCSQWCRKRAKHLIEYGSSRLFSTVTYV